MKDTSRILDLKYKLQTIELLNLAKEQYTYRELSGILHLPETVLSRYVKGHMLPTAERAEEINRTLQKYMSLEKELHERIKFDDLGYFDNTGIIIDSGETQRAMMKVILKARAEVIGIYALVAIGNEWKSRIESVGNVPVEIGLSLVKMVA